MYYQIGTLEPRGCIGSRAAQSNILEEAIEECRQRSLSRSVKEAWLREVASGKLGDIVVFFVKGVKM